MSLTSMQVHRGASSFQNVIGLIHFEATQRGFYSEPVGNTLVIWPAARGHVNGIQALGQTSVAIYGPIEEIDNYFKVSLWPLEVLLHARDFINTVNPNSRKVYAVFGLNADMETFMQSKQCATMRLGLFVTEGILHPVDFKAPPGIHISECSEISLNCSAQEGDLLWTQLRELSCSTGERKTYFKVKLAIQKPFWWQLTLQILLDSSTFSAVEGILQKMGIIWTTSKVKRELFCLDPTNVIMEKINNGLSQNYALTHSHSVSREMNEMPPKFTSEMLQSLRYNFGTLKSVGIPLPPVSFPSSQLVFAALKGTDDYWTFIEDTKYDRHIEPDCQVGIIMSALLSKF